VLALAASIALALRHLDAVPLPGCGLDSACERALGGRFGSLPGLAWPVAFLGASYFAALLAAWAAAGAGWPTRLRWLTRLGGLTSLGFLVLAFQQGTPCPFCLAAQLANLVFVACSERSRGPSHARAPELAFTAVALASTALLYAARELAGRAHEAMAERALAESTQALERGAAPRAFTGRYRRGPERAPLRLVLFTDYQCPDCARLEGQAWELAEERADLALSIKHFPLCKDCNRRARELGKSPHPNACWAARAAEAAGMVGGDDAFWRMHRWLFARKGAFTDAELRVGLGELALAPGAFLERMHSPETLARVQADVEEALALGIQNTPFVFLNGVELRGWDARDGLRRAVEAVAARAPVAAGPEADRPPSALEKALADWRLEPPVALPARAGEAPAADALEVVLWGDYLDPATRALDRELRARLAAAQGARYSFRHYPLDPECVPAAPNLHPGACAAARAAEAARVLGGTAAFERLHAALIEADVPLDDARLAALLAASGLEPAAVRAVSTGEARERVRADVEAAHALGLHSIPLLFVDGRRVSRWRVEGAELLAELLALARDERAGR
jgi:protein-disulfide isomerase